MDVRGVFHLFSRRPAGADAGSSENEALDIARYKYLLRVASPRVFDQVHVEAFAGLPDDRREAVWESMCRDLPEEGRPASPEPDDLARAAAWAQDEDPGYLTRVLRRPGPNPGTTGAGGGKPTTRYAGSVLAAVAAAASASPAAAEALKGFSSSVEAAQVDPSHYVPRSGSVDPGHGAEPPPGWSP